MPSPATKPDASLRATIAANIDRGIDQSGRTNRSVGEAIGATEHQVWRWRRGKQMPRDTTLAALAQELFSGDYSELVAPIVERRAA